MAVMELDVGKSMLACDGPSPLNSPDDIEAKGEWVPRSDSCSDNTGMHPAVNPRINGDAIGVDLVGISRRLDFLPCCEARIEQPHIRQPCRSRAVFIKMLRLVKNGAFRGNSEPSQIVEDCSRVFRATSCEISILDTNKQSALKAPSQLLVDERGEGVTDVQMAGGARRESKCGVAGLWNCRRAISRHFHGILSQLD